MTGAAFGLGLPVACTALGLGAHLGWVLPWDGRRTLRATVDIILKDVEVDEQRQHIPAHAQAVQLFNAVLRSVAEDPDHWRTRLSSELPFVDGSPLPLSAVERARLDRYVGRLETALGRYGRRVRFGGAQVARGVAGVIFDPRSYWNAIDLTGPGGAPDRPGPAAIDVTGTEAIDVRAGTRGQTRAAARADGRADARADGLADVAADTVARPGSRADALAGLAADTRAVARPGSRADALAGLAADPGAVSRTGSRGDAGHGRGTRAASAIDSGTEQRAGVGYVNETGPLMLAGGEAVLAEGEPVLGGGEAVLGEAEPLSRGRAEGVPPEAAEPLTLGEGATLLGGADSLPRSRTEMGPQGGAEDGARGGAERSGRSEVENETEHQIENTTGIRMVAGVELGVRADSGTGEESASGGKPSPRGPRRRSRH